MRRKYYIAGCNHRVESNSYVTLFDSIPFLFYLQTPDSIASSTKRNTEQIYAVNSMNDVYCEQSMHRAH